MIDSDDLKKAMKRWEVELENKRAANPVQIGEVIVMQMKKIGQRRCRVRFILQMRQLSLIVSVMFVTIGLVLGMTVQQLAFFFLLYLGNTLFFNWRLSKEQERC